MHQQLHRRYFESVEIRDILVEIRIRVSVLLTDGPDSFFSVFKDAKNLIFSCFSYKLPASTLSSVFLNITFFDKILCQNFILQAFFITLNTFMRKGKDRVRIRTSD